MPARVLIIDDHSIVRDTLRHVLETAGFDVVGDAPDLADGLRQARRCAPDVIVLDSVMPQTSGSRALGQTAAAAPTAGIVYLGTRDDPSYATAALREGATQYLFKDDAFDTIAAAVETAAHDGCRRGDGRQPMSRGEAA